MWANVGLQSLDSPPNSAYTCLPVRKLGDLPDARQAVPDLNQPAAWPVCGKSRELLLVCEPRRSAFGNPLLGGGGNGDGIASIHGEDPHCFFHTSIHPSAAPNSQAKCEVFGA